MTSYKDAFESIRGSWDPAFAGVAEAFAMGIANGQERGGQVAVFLHGEPVVDFLAGWNPPAGLNAGAGVAAGKVIDEPISERTPYPDNAVQLIFSQTKGLTGVAFADVVSRGLIDPEKKVTEYWPEFGAAGKENITVRQLVGHSAGMPGWAEVFDAAELFDWERVVGKLAEQAPRWEPGTAHGYHAITVGFLAGELIRRVTGLKPGEYLEKYFRAPGNLSVWIGLPESERHRLAAHSWGPRTEGWGAALSAAQADPDSTTTFAYRSPAGLDEAMLDPRFMDVEIPSVNGFADARSLASLYASFTDGPLNRYDDAVVQAVSQPVGEGNDEVLVGDVSRYGLVFQLGGIREPMISSGSFGHNGRGGCVSFADPASGIAFSYVENQLSSEPLPQSRVCRLVTAVRDGLAKC